MGQSCKYQDSPNPCPLPPQAGRGMKRMMGLRPIISESSEPKTHGSFPFEGKGK